MVMTEYVSLANIAEQLDIADSTVRKYAKVYKEFLPSVKREGERWAVYEASSAEIIAEISKLSQEGKKRHQIRDYLHSKYDTHIDGVVGDDATAQSQESNDTPATTLLLQHSDAPLEYMMTKALEALDLAQKNIEFYQTIANANREEADYWKKKAGELEDQMKQLEKKLEAEKKKSKGKSE